MADYHILAADRYGNSFGIVMHFPVPDQLNQAGYNYRQALLEYQGGAPIQSALPDAGAEQALLDTGALYEEVHHFHSNPAQNLPDKRAQLDAMYLQRLSEGQLELQRILSFWGYSREVP